MGLTRGTSGAPPKNKQQQNKNNQQQNNNSKTTTTKQTTNKSNQHKFQRAMRLARAVVWKFCGGQLSDQAWTMHWRWAGHLARYDDAFYPKQATIWYDVSQCSRLHQLSAVLGVYRTVAVSGDGNPLFSMFVLPSPSLTI